MSCEVTGVRWCGGQNVLWSDWSEVACLVE